MIKLVIADDEYFIRARLEKIISDNRTNIDIVSLCEDGEDVIKCLSLTKVDLLLMDIKMISVTGLEVAGYIFENKSTRGLKRIKFKILVILLVYEMFSLTGTLFSSIDSKVIIALYSVFAIGFSISVYLLPEKAMKQNFQTVMDDAIDNLNNKIWGEYNLMMKNSESKGENLDFSKVLSLIEMKEKLIELGKNRNRVQKIYEVIILLILAVIPVVVQGILEKL